MNVNPISLSAIVASEVLLALRGLQIATAWTMPPPTVPDSLGEVFRRCPAEAAAVTR
jgi:hypothetical protein